MWAVCKNLAHCRQKRFFFLGAGISRVPFLGMSFTWSKEKQSESETDWLSHVWKVLKKTSSRKHLCKGEIIFLSILWTLFKSLILPPPIMLHIVFLTCKGIGSTSILVVLSIPFEETQPGCRDWSPEESIYPSVSKWPFFGFRTHLIRL